MAPVATVPVLEESLPERVPALGSVIADKYRVEELIARGGMGAVYMATHLVSGKRVALKWMLPSLGQAPGAKERFVREACATARIEHPNVIDIYDVGNDRGSVYLVMELLRGETLAEFLQRTPQVPADQAVSILMPALRGVAAAHAHHVIHRDLKPDNIFLCRSSDGEWREPRVLDFGISKINAAEGPMNLALTSSGAVMGTPYYMSPEQVRGAKEVDERGDVYAFGVIFYEMLSGQRPFEAETYNQLILKIATEDPPPLAELQPELDPLLVAVVERAMARDPAQRFQSIEELAVALEPFAQGVSFRASTVRMQTSSDTSGERPSLRVGVPARRSRSFMALGIALGCLLAGGVLWALSRVQPTAAEPERRASTVQLPEPRVAAEPNAAQLPAAAAAPPALGLEPPPAAAELRETDVRAASRPEPAAKRAAKKAKLDPTAEAPAPAAPATPSQGKLPADWDDRLSIPTRPAAHVPTPAGRIDARDLR
ncbi:MAG TPA: serine/threonine-protein kinase [Polyangiales bacterium]|nr:serine/threonine-protein kinase [Polyangiales bacterium]